LAELAATRAQAAEQLAEASLAAAEKSLQSATAELQQAQRNNAANLAAAQSSLEKARSELGKAKGELARKDIAVGRVAQMSVTAVRAGTIGRVMARAGGETVKAGDPIAVLVPETESRAVEVYINGNDAPLISPGRKVRLQFQGWPAIQFVGWPSVAVGTFGGEVLFVDPSANIDGSFRVLVKPDASDRAWPAGIFLRQGTKVQAWVILNKVSIAYELWRTINGFPVSGYPTWTDGVTQPVDGKKGDSK